MKSKLFAFLLFSLFALTAQAQVITSPTDPEIKKLEFGQDYYIKTSFDPTPPVFTKQQLRKKNEAEVKRILLEYHQKEKLYFDAVRLIMAAVEIHLKGTK